MKKENKVNSGMTIEAAPVAIDIAPETPIIWRLNPTHGPHSTIVTISGGRFGNDPGVVIVKFNGKIADVISVTESFIKVRVPFMAGSGEVTVSVNGHPQFQPASFRYDLETIVKTVAGNIRGFADGEYVQARFSSPSGIISIGSLYVADKSNHSIRKVSVRHFDRHGIVSTVAGIGEPGFNDSNLRDKDAKF